MKRRHRLRDKARFQQVRDEGRSYVDDICVLVALKNDLPYTRAGFTASRRVGKATKRNRARRLMKEAVRRHFDEIAPGWDLVFVARPPIVREGFTSVEGTILRLLRRAGVLLDPGTRGGSAPRSGSGYGAFSRPDARRTEGSPDSNRRR